MASINVSGKLIDLSKPRVMGILNATPDSFYGKSRKRDLDEFISTARRMIEEGATFIDIGGYSSRPGADDIPVEEEIKRVIEPIRQIKTKVPNAIISIDTFRSLVAEKALEAGAEIVNDISGGNLDQNMHDFIASSKVPYIAMHMRGTPQTMKELTQYDDLLKEMISYFSGIIQKLTAKGVHDVILDPGFGFAKNIGLNFELIHKLELLKNLEKPLLVGVSRKSMIFKSLNISPDDALNGTTVLNTLALLKGASILRVHDVKPAIEAITLLEKANEL